MTGVECGLCVDEGVCPECHNRVGAPSSDRYWRVVVGAYLLVKMRVDHDELEEFLGQYVAGGGR